MKKLLYFLLLTLLVAASGCSDFNSEKDVTLEIFNSSSTHWLVVAVGTRQAPDIIATLLPLETRKVLVKAGKCILLQTCVYNDGYFPTFCIAFDGHFCYSKDTSIITNNYGKPTPDHSE